MAESQLREIACASHGTISIERIEQTLGWYWVSLSIGFAGVETAEGGLHLRAREKFVIVISRDFPFRAPSVKVPHTRFAYCSHVQWKRQLCLYGSSVEWRPQDGMFGFIRRLDAWIRDAVNNNLDSEDAPLHPPVAYSVVDDLLVPKANTPVVANKNWFGVAELQIREGRVEIVGWKRNNEPWPTNFAPAILLHEKFPFEYPSTVGALLEELSDHGIDRNCLLRILALYSCNDSTDRPLTVILGTPMRRPDPSGPILQHLAAWQLSTADTNQLREVGRTLFTEGLQSNFNKQPLLKWCDTAKVGWCNLEEMRPEVTRRRDYSSDMSWFCNKRVAIWGCGAIGSNVAEFIVRAGASHLVLVDQKVVTPGILVRQGFEDADIGKPKVDALGNRLMKINPNLTIKQCRTDLITHLVDENRLVEVDLIIDCTASQAVRSVLEYNLLRFYLDRPPIASIAIDGQASAAISTLAKPAHSGCSLDLFRRLKLEACRNPSLNELLEAFWPQSGIGVDFQPEPGCSEPTFVGSHADLAGLTARSVNSIANELKRECEHTGVGWMFENRGSIQKFSWSPDRVLVDTNHNYSIRVCSLVEREMKAWTKRSSRVVEANVETGGLVFGEIDEAAGVVWATEVDGPPADSHASKDHFTCGIVGTKEAVEGRRKRFHGSVNCIGTWHTHPNSSSLYSRTDELAAEQFLNEPNSDKSSCLLLILAGDRTKAELGAHLFKRSPNGKPIVSVRATRHLDYVPKKSKDIGLALSGGGSRAIAFHLGCLRALNDLNLLGRVQVISSVSGGSIIAAMYAYSTDSFLDFDRRVVEFLGRGIQWDIVRRILHPKSVFRWLSTRANRSRFRTFSRTEVFREFLSDHLFGYRLVKEVARPSLDVVINTTELQTGSAFRFGSRRSGCWRYGTISGQDALLADAVAASAAYPLVLPALERKYRFTKCGETSSPTRVLLSDGGAFENLGVSPMEPGRDSTISTNVFNPKYIVCCDAGTGLLESNNYPTSWFRRNHRTAKSIFRKVQDAARNRLHLISNNNDLKGFVLCYLGQQDKALPWIPSGMPTRSEVKDYKTNFASLSNEDIHRLSVRGELLMRFLCAYYLADC
ncbi:MAG: ThiF family adenylyltransferase [Gammaproteobacteria bacterium]|nr:ThiF family adenylyltransferase [Gammaproteobacteria bacterium]